MLSLDNDNENYDDDEFWKIGRMNFDDLMNDDDDGLVGNSQLPEAFSPKEG